MDTLSMLYINLFPHNPLNLSLVKRYLLSINAYAFGSVLSQILKQVTRHKIGGDG